MGQLVTAFAGHFVNDGRMVFHVFFIAGAVLAVVNFDAFKLNDIAAIDAIVAVSINSPY